jgi:hypothetical protein
MLFNHLDNVIEHFVCFENILETKKELEVLDFASFFQNQPEINKKDMPINQREM